MVLDSTGFLFERERERELQPTSRKPTVKIVDLIGFS